MGKRPGAKVDAVAKAKGWTVEAILSDPHLIDLHECHAVDFLERNRSNLEPALLHRADVVPAQERLRIGILLLHMGSRAGSDLVLRSLASSDPDIVKDALWFCRSMPWRLGQGLIVPLDQPAAAAALQPFLSSADPDRQHAAIDALCRLSDPGSVQRLADLLAHRDGQVMGTAARHLATYHGDERAWPVLRSLFDVATSNERYDLIISLRGFEQSRHGTLRDEVAEFARRELESLYEKQDIHGANEVLNLLQVLQSLAPGWETGVLRDVIASGLPAWVKAYAALRLTQLEDATAAEQQALGWFEDPDLAPYALENIRKMGARANRPALVSRLQAELAGDVSNQRLYDLLDVFVAIGAEDAVDIGRFIDRVDGWRRFDLMVRSRQVPADAMLGLLLQAGLIPEADQEACTRFTENWRQADCLGTVVKLLHEGGRLHMFDCEGSDTPPDYASLIGELTALSDQETTATKVTVSEDHETGLSLVVEIPPHTISAKLQYQGDWFDVGGVLSALNRHLSETGSSRRYFALAATDQVACVVLAEAKAMARLASDWDFPVNDPGEARRLGQEYESDALRSLHQT